jgi:hypothetical protein
MTSKCGPEGGQGQSVSGAIRHQFTDSLNAFTIERRSRPRRWPLCLRSNSCSAPVCALADRPRPRFIGADGWSGSTYTGVDYMGEGIIVASSTRASTAITRRSRRPAATASRPNPLGSGNYLGDCAGTIRQWSATTS